MKYILFNFLESYLTMKSDVMQFLFLVSCNHNDQKEFRSYTKKNSKSVRFATRTNDLMSNIDINN